MNNPLFFEASLKNQLHARQRQVGRAVNDIPEEQFTISNDRELVDCVVAKLKVEPLVLQEDSATMPKQPEETQGGPFYIRGTRMDVDIPFTGEGWVFRYRTNSFSLNPPQHVEVHEGYLRISILLPHDIDPKQFKETYRRELELIKKYVKLSHDQVMDYNRDLPRLVQQAIANRRQRLGKHADIASLLDIPLATKPGAPSIAPVKVEIRHPPQLPVPPIQRRRNLSPEPFSSPHTQEEYDLFIAHASEDKDSFV